MITPLSAAWVGTLARRRCGRVGRGEGPRVRGGFPVRLDGVSPSRRGAARSAGLIGAVVRRDRPGSRMRWLPAAAGLFAVDVAGHAGGSTPAQTEFYVAIPHGTTVSHGKSRGTAASHVGVFTARLLMSLASTKLAAVLP